MSHSYRRFVLALVFIAALFAVQLPLSAQQLSSITGTVTDSTGAAIPGVNVALRSATTGAEYKAVSNGAGLYTINDVKPGPDYVLTLSVSGFQTEKISGIYMNVAATRTQNVTLKIGQSVQTVTVSAASQNETLDTTDATLGNNFQVQFLQQLPVQLRDSPAALFTQQPGVTADGAVTGARTDQDRVTLDGLDVNDMATGQFGAVIGGAPVDSVQEFRGVVAGDQAGAIAGGGGHFQLITRSGTNQFHGNLNEYHRDTALEANDWFNNNSGVGRPPLIRNQFGGDIGGPILRNKLFFYFDYDGRRDTLSNVENRTVPLDSFRNGNLSYFNKNGGVSTLDSAQVAQLDPQHIGFNPALLSLFNSRYPHSNNSSVGDGINFGGYQFNAPFHYKENLYVGRVDYTINSKMKLFAVAHVTRINGTQSAIQFPGDPQTSPFENKSYSWVVGHTWAINASMVNQAYFGETYEDYSFPNTYNPTGITQYGTVGGTGTGGSVLSSPYASAINAQGRTYPIPVARDNFNWLRGNHDFSFGGDFKWPSPNGYSILNYNSPTIGLGGNMNQLNASLRPSDVGSGNAASLYDEAFALALAPYSAESAIFNYNANGDVRAQGSGLDHHYRYYEWELFAADTWKVRPTLSLTYGVRWQVFTDPYDINGIESVQNFNFNDYFYGRVAQSQAGIAGPTAVPFITYMLGGKANNAPGYFNTNFHNIAPNFGFAWNPAFLNGKTVFNGSAGIVYDQTVINAVQYQQAQYSYLFQNSVNVPYGVPNNPVASLQQDARFNGLDHPPTAPAAPAFSNPLTPYVSGTGANANPYGLANGQAFNEIINPNLTTPYSIQFNLGMQQQLPKGLILKISYVGRLGRHLLAQADANQLIDFPDKQSNQLMSQAFANVEKELRAGADPTNLQAEPWFEDVVAPGVGQAQGFPNNTSFLATAIQTLFSRGDMADTVQALAAAGLIPDNVGMGSQFSENTFYTNMGFSAYNGMLVTLHKNLSNGLQFDLNYTWSHSIDNVSLVANQAALGGYGFICDVLRPRECRGNSDFDVTNYFTGNFIYDLPFGRGRSFAGTAPLWLDEVIGGWQISGIPTWHTGNAYFAASNAFVAGYANNAPAILTGPIADLKFHRHGGEGQPLNAYADPTKAANDYTGPVGFEIGSRNNLRGPSYFDLDLGLGKTFPIYANRVKLNFRADAFNATNHPNFADPSQNSTASNDITSSSIPFGTISSTVPSPGGVPLSGSGARVLQLSLRLSF